MLYFVLLGGSAAGLYVYRSLFHKSVKRKLPYQVVSVEHQQKITTIWLKPLSKALAFYAGQFGFFTFRSSAVDTESHPFSLSSNSNDANLRIAAKESGDFTEQLPKLAVGDRVEVEGPFGQFSFAKQTGKQQVWVAGGIGITPFLSMAQSLPADYKVTLYYCVNSLDQAIFLEELEREAAHNTNLKVVTICTDQNQRLTGQQIVSADMQEYLLCAPPAMMHDLEKQLLDLGVPKTIIHYEDFALV
jgi:predicted ferric reductase